MSKISVGYYLRPAGRRRPVGEQTARARRTGAGGGRLAGGTAAGGGQPAGRRTAGGRTAGGEVKEWLG